MDIVYMIGFVLIPSIFNAAWAALKYYSNTIGNNPETFDMRKFLPFVILGVGISIYTALTLQDVTSSEQIIAIMGQNLGYLVTINLIIDIIKKQPFVARYLGGV